MFESREVDYGFPDENQQYAEAVDVVHHALWKATRGGRQGGKGRNPSMVYSGSRSRNPRECLQRACEDLGFTSLKHAREWFSEQPADWSKKLQLNFKPQPLNIEGLDFSIMHPYVQLDYPTRLQKYLSF